MTYLRSEANGELSLTVYLQPRAAKNEVVGVHDGEALKIRLTAPPVEGQANKAAIAFLAKFLHLPKAAIRLQSGQQSRSKRFILTGLTLAEAERLIANSLP